MTDRATQLDRYCALPKPDRRKIWEWAHDAIHELPANYAIRGRFNVNNSPWLRDPFDSMIDPLVRHTTVIKAVQSGGTLLAEITTAYRIANDPGPATFTCQSDEMATLEGKTRMFPLLESIPQIARILPRPGPMRTTTEIFFPGGIFFILNSANLSHQQSQSVRHKVNDEVWHPRWADVYDDACKRVTAFEQQGISHILDISQGGVEGDHSDRSFKNGSMEEWSANCDGCKKSMPLHFHQKMTGNPDKRAGVVWSQDARRSDKTWDDVRAAETARFICPHCGHEHGDTDATRAKWRKSGNYVVSRANPPREWKSYHWEALVAHPIALLVKEWCQAESHFQIMGDEEPRKKFRQKREARAWVESKQSITVTTGSDYTVEDYWNGNLIPNEVHRFMTIDRQEDHYWCEVGACTARPEYRQLFFDRVDTAEMLRIIQHRYKVADTCVAQDRRYNSDMVDRECLAYGWRGMEGMPKKTWTLKNELTDLTENCAHSYPLYTRENVCYYQFSADHCKDVVANGIKGKSAFKWLLPKNVNPLYLEHIKAEERKQVRPGVWKWEKVKRNNHGLDTSSMMACVMIITGVYKLVLASNE